MVIHPDYDIRPLVYAVIELAIRQARAGNQEARAWLLGDGLAWCQAAGIEADEKIKRWVMAGCKPARQPKRRRDPDRWKKYQARPSWERPGCKNVIRMRDTS